MAPAVQRAFNERADDDRLNLVFGPAPRVALIGIALGGLIGGSLLGRIDALDALAEHVNFAAVLIGLTYAVLIRRYLFQSGHANADDFPWLAGSVVPAVALLTILNFIQRTLNGGAAPLDGAPVWTAVATTLDSVASALVVAAALVIAVAALCYTRDWRRALTRLARQLILFKVVVFVMVLLLVEIGIVGPILSRLLSSTLGIQLPSWLGDVADRFTHAALMATLYLFIIGATWTAARAAFPELLRSGEADVLDAVRKLAKPEPEPDDDQDRGSKPPGPTNTPPNGRAAPAVDN